MPRKSRSTTTEPQSTEPVTTEPVTEPVTETTETTEPTRRRRQKKDKPKKDPNAPKRAASAYILFAIDERKKIKKDTPDLANKQIIVEIGQRWQALSSTKKSKYERQHEKEVQRYQKEMANYVVPEEFKSKAQKRRERAGPKRPKSAYICFCGEERQRVKAKHPEMSSSEIVSELGRRWKALSDKKKAPFVRMAEDDKARYTEEVESMTVAEEQE